MSMLGEGMVSTYEAEVLAGLDFVPESYAIATPEVPAEAALALRGLGANTAVMRRAQEQAVEDQELQAAGVPVTTKATMFQSSY